MRDTFHHTDILKIYPTVKVRSMLTWSERGLIQPLQDAAGRGSSRIYSYKNLIEIGIIGELTRYGFSFSHISALMRSANMQYFLQNGEWDMVVWFAHGTPAGVPNRDNLICSGSAPISKFVAQGGMMLAGPNGLLSTVDPMEFTSTVLVLNISMIKNYIETMINKL
jgi:hypothetical protein